MASVGDLHVSTQKHNLRNNGKSGLWMAMLKP